MSCSRELGSTWLSTKARTSASVFLRSCGCGHNRRGLDSGQLAVWDSCCTKWSYLGEEELLECHLDEGHRAQELQEHLRLTASQGGDR